MARNFILYAFFHNTDLVSLTLSLNISAFVNVQDSALDVFFVLNWLIFQTSDEDLIAQEEEVKETILKFHSSIRDSISHTSYVIDFYIKKDGGVLIIELNPFHNGAGSFHSTSLCPYTLTYTCLFLWLRRGSPVQLGQG